MGNNQSTTEVKHTDNTKTWKRKAKNKSNNKTVKQNEQPGPDNAPDTMASYKVNSMFPPEMPTGIVGRLKGWKYVVPFTVLMSSWTKSGWPYDGSFEKEKLELAEVNISQTGNPAWDSKYMRECMDVWVEIASKRCGVTLDGKDSGVTLEEKECEWISDESSRWELGMLLCVIYLC